MFGCSHETEIVGHYPWEFSPPFQPDGSASKVKATALMQAASQGAPQKFYWKHVRKDGREFDAEVSLNRLDIPGASSFQAIVREITELRLAREALQKGEAEYRSLFDMVSDALALIEIETGRMLDVNKAFIDLYGYGREEILAMKNTDFSAEPDKTREATQAHGVYIPVRWHKKKDGTVFPTEITARILNYKGRDVHMAAIRDITERQRYEAQRQRFQKMESLGLLAGGVAHDLNNVLSGIVSYPELLLLDLPGDSVLRKPIETIRDSGRRAAAIVEDLLTIARGVVVSKEPLDLNDLIKDYLTSPEFGRLQQFHPGVSVRMDLDPCLPNVLGSFVHVRKVLMNLISNAAEAIEGEGTITIASANRYVDEDLKGYADVKKDEYVVLTVADDGTGMSAQEIERIFEPFYTKKVMGRSGTGLGLAVVWNVVQDHRGYIDVKSDAGGTHFTLYFPLSRDAVSACAEAVPLDAYKGRGEKILVVDDVANQREIACALLERLGYQTAAVAGGAEAVAYLKAHPVDLVILDMIMNPGMNGRETYAKIAAMRPGQKAILVSGFAETDDVLQAQEMGAGCYVKKPYSLEKIGIAVRDELNRKPG